MSNQAYTMRVDGMTCAHCEETVTRALEAAGAHDARSSFRRGEALFKLPADSDETKIAELTVAVREAGYEPGVVAPIDSQQMQRSDRAAVGVTAVAERPDGFAGDQAEYDLAIIGSGGAAMAAAIAAMGRNARVVMIERGVVGGTCVNIGCIPSKTLLRGSEIYHQSAQHPFAGIQTSAGEINLRAFIAQKERLVAELRRESTLR